MKRPALSYLIGLPMECYASCPAGFEHDLALELKRLGANQVRPLKGRVSFEADARGVYRTCLRSRLASRIFAVLGRFDAADADALYEGARALAWEDMLADGATVSVSARGTNDSLRNTQFTALRVKDALCDRMAEKTGSRPYVDPERAGARIAVTLRGDRASVAFDMTGEPLFKRLPPEAVHDNTARVLRPDFAALVLERAGWGDACREALEHGTLEAGGLGPVLVDVACSGGGVAVEAASIALGRIPGLARRRWGFEGWAGYDSAAWNETRSEAEAEDAAHSNDGRVRVVATDSEASCRGMTGRMVRAAGCMGAVRVCKPEADAVRQALADAQEGTRGASRRSPFSVASFIVADLAGASLDRLAPSLSLAAEMRLSCPQAGAACLADTSAVERAFGGAPDERLDVRPGNEAAEVFSFVPLSEAGGEDRSPVLLDLGDRRAPALVPESDQFVARLKKVAKQRRKWAAREGVSCYRVYDADLPDYSVAIDVYNGSATTPGRWLVIAEYQAPKSIDPELAQARFLDVLSLAPRILDVKPEHVFAKARLRAKGGSQYAQKHRPANAAKANGEGSTAPGKRPILVEEGGLTFEVDFDERLDTGLFLDHRITRDLVRREAARLAEKGLGRFLNLFAYTGSATCYAADGGATETVTVDLSNTYLDWADRNLWRNGFKGDEHELIRADVLAWIDAERHGRRRWDLIFCDPPTFSNSSSMRARSFDVQRDHVELLIGVSRLLTREGEAIFSCNLRTFKPDLEKLARAGVVLRDVTRETIPEDFARNPRIHRCYILTRTTPEEALRRLDENSVANCR